MPDSPAQAHSSLSFTRTTTSTQSVTLSSEIKAKVVQGQNKATVEFWQTLDPSAAKQQTSFVATGTMAVNDTVFATITDADTNINKYVLDAAQTKTLAQLLSDLTALINIDDDIVATVATGATAGTITLTSAQPGRAFTVTVGAGGSNTGSAALGTVTTIVANAAGTIGSGPKHRKIAEVDVTPSVSEDGSNQLTNTIRFYNGAGTPVVSQTQTSAPYKHPLTLSEILAAQQF